MKNSKIFLLVFTGFFTACTSNNSVIEGTLPSDKYDKQVVFWVPMEGEHPKPVDSTHVQKNTFRLVISPHNLNKMGIVRVRPQLRLALQEILVFTEPGTVNVHLDSISRATGTPLNETLQFWKDRKRTYDVDTYRLRRKYRTAGEDEQSSIRVEMENVSAEYHNDIYQLIVENKDNDLGKFLYSLHKGRFTTEQTEELSNYQLENIKNEK